MPIRVYTKEKIVISDDLGNDPRQIRYSEETEVIDVTNYTETLTRQQIFNVGNHTIDLSSFASGKLLIIKSKLPVSPAAGTVSILLNGSLTSITLENGKTTKIWANITSLDLVVATDPVELTIVVAGV